jgi:hypothetical protein
MTRESSLKVGDMFKTIVDKDSLFMGNSIVEITKIGKTRIRYKYIEAEMFFLETKNDYSQSLEDFKHGTVKLTELNKALL